MAQYYVDEQGNEIPESQRDFSDINGYWEITHEKDHYEEGTKPTPLISHFIVKRVYFTNNTFYEPSLDDPHIKVIDANNGVFEYVFLEGEEKKEVRNLETEEIIEQNYRPGIPGHWEYNTINIYHPYTQEERQSILDEYALQEKRQLLIDTGADRLSDAEATMEDLVLMMADIAGGEA